MAGTPTVEEAIPLLPPFYAEAVKRCLEAGLKLKVVEVEKT